MPLTLSVCLVVARFGLWVASLLIASRAKPDDQMPFWKNPKNNPARSLLYRALGAGLLIAGFVYLGSDLGVRWVALLLVIMATPALVISTRHNRRVTAS